MTDTPVTTDRTVVGTSQIAREDFCRLFGRPQNEFDDFLQQRLSGINTRYLEANLEEFQEYTLQLLKRIYEPGFARTRDENLDAFEQGWRENLVLANSGEFSPEALKPKYFRPSKFLRYNGKLVVVENRDLEYDLFTITRYLLFRKYLADVDHYYELGCGSCQNLYLLSEMYPGKSYHGLDWAPAARDIADYIGRVTNRRFEGHLFDMTDPSSGFGVKPRSAILTIHALEQLGDRHEKFLSFLIRSKPEIVVQYEPILEFYDPGNLLDYLALLYSKKRNYLKDYYAALLERQARGEISIIEARRPYIGGVVHESSVIVWKPVGG